MLYLCLHLNIGKRFFKSSPGNYKNIPEPTPPCRSALGLITKPISVPAGGVRRSAVPHRKPSLRSQRRRVSEKPPRNMTMNLKGVRKMRLGIPWKTTTIMTLMENCPSPSAVIPGLRAQVSERGSHWKPPRRAKL